MQVTKLYFLYFCNTLLYYHTCISNFSRTFICKFNIAFGASVIIPLYQSEFYFVSLQICIIHIKLKEDADGCILNNKITKYENFKNIGCGECRKHSEE